MRNDDGHIAGPLRLFLGSTAACRIRTARRDANTLIDPEQKGSLLTEDEASSGKDQVQELTKTNETKVDDMIEHKRKEVMTV